MKKTKIYNIVIASICFALWFMPIHLWGYDCIIKSFILMIFNGNFIINFHYLIRETLVVVIGCVAIVFSILNIIKDSTKTRLLATVGVGLYVIIWVIAIFVQFPGRTTILYELLIDANTYIIWLTLYFVMLLAIIALTILQYFPMRKQTKTERLEARIDELEKQVDDLKKDE